MTYHDYPVLIGLGGRKTAGKDAVADVLAHASDVVKIGMSDALHDIALTLDPWIRTTVAERLRLRLPIFRIYFRYADLDTRLGYVALKTVAGARAMLQTLGTEVGREKISLTLWTDMTSRAVAEHLAAGTSVVVTGIRFPNELWMIRDLGGISLWVDRPGLSTDDAHASEGSVDATDFDVVLTNGGSLDDLRVTALLTVEAILSARDEVVGHVRTHEPRHLDTPAAGTPLTPDSDEHEGIPA